MEGHGQEPGKGRGVFPCVTTPRRHADPRLKPRLAPLLLFFVSLATWKPNLGVASPAVTAASPGDEPAGWTTPRPPYAAAARLKHEQGIIYLTVTTDAHGVVTKAVASTEASEKHDLSDLETMSVKWALACWHGPPKVTRKVRLDFRFG